MKDHPIPGCRKLAKESPSFMQVPGAKDIGVEFFKLAAKQKIFVCHAVEFPEC